MRTPDSVARAAAVGCRELGRGSIIQGGRDVSQELLSATAHDSSPPNIAPERISPLTGDDQLQMRQQQYGYFIARFPNQDAADVFAGAGRARLLVERAHRAEERRRRQRQQD